MTSITRRYRFCAAHRLHSDLLSAFENNQTYGKCNNPYGHGHDYLLEVSVTGPVNLDTGLIVRLADLDNCVANEVLSDFAHRNLNSDVAEFSALVPTTENVALVIAQRLSERWRNYFPYSEARLTGICIYETDRNSFEVLLHQLKHVAEPAIQLTESVIVNA